MKKIGKCTKGYWLLCISTSIYMLAHECAWSKMMKNTRLISETYQEKSYTISLLSIQIDKYEKRMLQWNSQEENKNGEKNEINRDKEIDTLQTHARKEQNMSNKWKTGRETHRQVRKTHKKHTKRGK